MKTWSAQQLRELVEPALTEMGFELHELQLLGRGPQTVVRLFLDREGGIGLDDCEAASKLVSRVFDEAEPFATRYTLEVSSPGIDRPLSSPRDYQRQLGHKVNLRFRDGEGETVLQGRVVEVGEAHVVVEPKAGPAVEVGLESVLEARPVIEI
ncbi:MAG: ribosome maturation factor RimP [Candidatus Dormibacteria bacterium]